MNLYNPDLEKIDGFVPEFNKMNEVLNAAMQKHVAKVSDVYEKSVRENSTPPIKGEITKGKLRWRGIRRVVKNEFPIMKEWIEQRGVIISPVIECECVVVIR